MPDGQVCDNGMCHRDDRAVTASLLRSGQTCVTPVLRSHPHPCHADATARTARHAGDGRVRVRPASATTQPVPPEYVCDNGVCVARTRASIAETPVARWPESANGVASIRTRPIPARRTPMSDVRGTAVRTAMLVGPRLPDNATAAGRRVIRQCCRTPTRRQVTRTSPTACCASRPSASTQTRPRLPERRTAPWRYCNRIGYARVVRLMP